MTDRFDRLEIHPIKDAGDEAIITSDAKADYFTLYGYIAGKGEDGIYVAIGDYPNREAAELTSQYIRAI